MPEKTTSFEYLLKCSEMSLQDFELARLDRVASLRKRLREIAEEWVEAAVEAQLARWVREQRTRKSSSRTLDARGYHSKDLPQRADRVPAPHNTAARLSPPLSLPAPKPISPSPRQTWLASRTPAEIPARRRTRNAARNAFSLTRHAENEIDTD